MLSDGYSEMAREKHGRLLIVDDEESVLQALRRLFHRQYDVVTHTSGAAALEQLQNERFDVIISDMRMPQMTGAELLKSCFELYPQMIRILLTGYSDLESAIKAVNEGNIYRYVSKPWDNDQLRALIAEAIDTRDLKEANQKLSAHIVSQNQELERLKSISKNLIRWAKQKRVCRMPTAPCVRSLTAWCTFWWASWSAVTAKKRAVQKSSRV